MSEAAIDDLPLRSLRAYYTEAQRLRDTRIADMAFAMRLATADNKTFAQTMRDLRG